MTAAAQRLSVTQSAVSQLIRQLEATLEVTLFDRDCRPMVVTAAGERLQELAGELIKQAELLPRLVQKNAHKPLGAIRLGLVDSFAAALGAELIYALESRAQSVTAWSGLSPLLTDSLANRQLDLVITTDLMKDHEDYESTYLFRDPFILIVPANQSVRATQVDLHDLAANLPLIRYSIRSTIGLQVNRHLRRIGIDAPMRYEFDATYPLLKMVESGLGWAISTPICLLGSNFKQGAYHVLPLPGTPLFRNFQVTVHRGRLGTLAETIQQIVPRLLHMHHMDRLGEIAPWLTLNDFEISDS